MGQQQLLLIILGVIVVGIAIFLGITLFQTNAVEHKRDLLINEGLTVATNAREYYYKPSQLGGGQYSFDGWDIPPQMRVSGNGSFVVSSTSSNQVEIIGTGNELISGNDSIRVQFIVSPLGIQASIIN